MHRLTLALVALTTAALLAGCAGPPAEESTHTQPPGDVGVSNDVACAPASDASGAGEERVAGDPIGDVATRDGGPSTGDGNDQVPPACEDPVTAPGSTPQG